MRRIPVRIAALALLGLLVAVAAPVADARAVDFERETHFRCYVVSAQTPTAPNVVILDDQFMPPTTLTVDEPLQFFAPTSKNDEGIAEPDEHLTMYAAPQELTPHLRVFTEDQFGPRTLEVVGARVLLVPTQKLVGDLEFPARLNHYWCYEANGPRVRQSVTLDDQFGAGKVRVETPRLFCNPVAKEHAGAPFPIVERDVHLTCYEIRAPHKTRATTFEMDNQLEHDRFTVTAFELLCVPSDKIRFEEI